MSILQRSKACFPSRFLMESRGRLCLSLMLLLMLFFSCACGSVPVAQDLSQKQANEIVAALGRVAINSQAEREVGAGARYRVEVKHEFYQQAIAFLHEQGLPQEEHPSFDELIAQHGIVPNSREIEALRLDRAHAAEIEQSLANIPALVAVRVTVRMRSLAVGLDGQMAEKSGVSVVLTERAGQQVSLDEVRRIVISALPGISPENVLIVKHNQEQLGTSTSYEGLVNNGTNKPFRVPLTAFLGAWRVPEGQYNSMALALVSCLLLVAALGGLLGYYFARMRYSRQSARQPLTASKASRIQERDS